MKAGDLVKPAPGCETITKKDLEVYRYGIGGNSVPGSEPLMWEIQWNTGRDSGYWFEEELEIIAQ